jgi:hypothetical protein
MIYLLNNRDYIDLVIMLYHNTANYSWEVHLEKPRRLAPKLSRLSKNILTSYIRSPRLLLRIRFCKRSNCFVNIFYFDNQYRYLY